MVQRLFILGVLCLAVLMLAACSKNDGQQQQQAQKQQPQQSQQQQQLPQGHPPIESLEQGQPSGDGHSVAGITWKVPEKWQPQGQRPMRIATYSVPGEGECAVFFFGGGEGGNVDANIDRWASQFEGSPKPERSTKTVNGMQVTLVQIAGTYLAPGGPMMQSQGKKDNYRLLGAIVNAPQGSVFFKFTGPAKTIANAQDDFNSLISSLAKTPAQS